MTFCNFIFVKVMEMRIELGVLTLEQGVRREYYQLINDEKLVRAMDTKKIKHFNLPSGQQVYFIPNCMNFQQV